jgi:hypothetical protein
MAGARHRFVEIVALQVQPGQPHVAAVVEMLRVERASCESGQEIAVGHRYISDWRVSAWAKNCPPYQVV